MKLEELQVYQIAMDIGEKVWGIVNKWDYFSKDTIEDLFMKQRHGSGRHFIGA
jgi:hypothetical protein